MAARYYNGGLYSFLSDPYTAANLQVLLVYDTYTFDKDHDFISDVVAHEAAGTGYARVTPSTKTLTIDDANDQVILDADDFNYTTIDTGGTQISGYILAENGGNDATDRVIFFNDSGGFPKTLSGTDFNVVHDVTLGISYFKSPA